jgi:hypothetical protein
VSAVANRSGFPWGWHRILTLARLVVTALLLQTHAVRAQFKAHRTGVVAIYGVETTDTLAEQLDSQFRLFGWEVLFVSDRARANQPLIAELYFAYGYNSVQPSTLTLKGPSLDLSHAQETGSRSVAWSTLASDQLEPGLHPRVIALRAAELVRAAVVAPAVTEQRASTAQAPLVRASESRLSLGLSAGLLSGETLGRSFSLVPRCQVFLNEQWNAEIVGSVPVTVNRVTRDEGQATLRVFLVGAGVGHRSELIRASLLVDMSVGGGAAVVPMEGQLGGAHVARSESVRTAFAYGQTRFSLAILEGVRISAGGLLGYSLPAVSVRFDSRSLGKWGQPMFLMSAGIETR